MRSMENVNRPSSFAWKYRECLRMRFILVLPLLLFRSVLHECHLTPAITHCPCWVPADAAKGARNFRMLLLLLIRTLAAATVSRCVGRAISKHASYYVLFIMPQTRGFKIGGLCALVHCTEGCLLNSRNDELNPQLAKEYNCSSLSKINQPAYN
jgi:hypothetical protein